MTTAAWWGEFAFDSGQRRRWHLAGLDLQVQRSAQEWLIDTHRPPEQREDDYDWRIDDSPDVMPERAVFQRFIFNQTGERLRVLPRLADRPVVIKPINPLFISANQAVTLFVSTPVWVTVSVAHGADKALVDVPVVRPTETWFGVSPIRGQLCYATPVLGRIDLAQLPIRPFRAVTPVHIRNHSADTMPVERISIPAPLLPLYSAEDGRLWTPPIEVERLSSGRASKARIDIQLPAEAGAVRLLSPARQDNEDNLIRLFEHFF